MKSPDIIRNCPPKNFHSDRLAKSSFNILTKDKYANFFWDTLYYLILFLATSSYAKSNYPSLTYQVVPYPAIPNMTIYLAISGHPRPTPTTWDLVPTP